MVQEASWKSGSIPGLDPGQAGEIMSLSLLRNTSVPHLEELEEVVVRDGGVGVSD